MSALLEVRGLSKRFAEPGRGPVQALAGVDLDLERGETLGVVGESGCGKSTLARCLVRLERPSAGSVRFDGVELTRLSARALRPIRRRMQIVFQDPAAALNPRLTVGDTLGEPLGTHRVVPPGAVAERSLALLTQVGLGADLLGRFPHELSAGQRQRLCIARALSVEPELIVADEPVSSLDASVQAQVINLLVDLRTTLGLTYLFIAHDLALVRHLSDRVAVMYAGRFVEEGPAAELYGGPAHPYTRLLHAATPHLGRPLPEVATMAPAPGAAIPAQGCAFAPRCPLAVDRCLGERPELRSLGPGHRVACHLA